jgi:hypothetical protein
MRALFMALTGTLLLCGCRQAVQHPQQESARPAGETQVADRGEIPSFSAELAQLDDGGLGEFLDDNAGETVFLDVTIPPGDFQGGQERDFAFFTIYEDCPEDLVENEKPNASKCEGTEYLLPKHLLKLEGDDYRLSGYFRSGAKSGPLQGMFSVQLEPRPLAQ